MTVTIEEQDEILSNNAESSSNESSIVDMDVVMEPDRGGAGGAEPGIGSELPPLALTLLRLP